MNYINDKILKEGIHKISQHKDAFELDFEVHSKIYKIEKENDSKNNLKQILRPLIQARRRGKLSKDECQILFSSFDKKYTKIKQIGRYDEGEEAIDKIVKELHGIHNLGWKIVGVFLKDVVYNCHIWSHLIDYLYLPIDTHIHKIFTEKLQVISKEHMPTYEHSYLGRKNKRFQDELKMIHNPRIEFDWFWYIGNRFCSNRISCDLCWIKDFCRKKW